MKILDPNWEEIHNSRKAGLFTFFLWLSSFPYRAAVNLRAWAYAAGILKQSRLPGPVVSIGNITTGGTGKTPATIMMAEWARSKGYKVAILSRGYKRSSKEDILAVSDGKNILADPREAGDEPWLLASRLRGVPVIVSVNRYAAGLYAAKRFGANFFILDDGFQHLRVARDVDILLVNSQNPFGNAQLLPLGPLREPLSHMKRATLTILTNMDTKALGNSLKDTADLIPGFKGNEPGPLVKTLRRYGQINIFYACHVPSLLVFPFIDKKEPPAFLNKKKVIAFAGIAHPESFKNTLLELGANILYFKKFNDHYTFSSKDISLLLKMRDETGADIMITTEKDWSRLVPLSREIPFLAFLRVRFSILPDQEKTFFDEIVSIHK